MNMGSNAATARIHCRPTISEKTAAALIEMMQCAAKQECGYEGPIQVEIIGRPAEGPPPDPDTNNYPRPQEDFFYAQYSF